MAKRVSEKSIQGSQLCTFIKSLGITNAPEIYVSNSLAYVNIDIILPILSVPLTWFLKNADSPTHFISIKNKIFVNKYGLTKILAQSKEEVSFRLQDYLYELLYRVETKGHVSKTELISRTELIKAYEVSMERAELTLTEFKEANDILRCDISVIETENARLKDSLATTEENLSQLQMDYEAMKTIANKLARLVRLKSKNPPTEAFDSSLDIIEEDDGYNAEEDAIEAKTQLKKPTAIRRVKKITATTKEYILYQSHELPDGNYMWQLSDRELQGENLTEFIRLSLSDEKRKVISLFLSLQDSYPEHVIERLLNS